VHFQASQWGSQTEGQFTINLAVAIPAAYEFWTGRPFPKNPATALFPLQQRLGLLTPERRDRWWSVGAEVDSEKIAGEIAGLLENIAVPFFAQYPNSAAVLDSLRRGHRAPGLSNGQVSLVHAILANCAGSETEAARALNRALAESAATPFRATVLLISQRLGLKPSDA
jgi:hypothetical protein